MTIDRSKIPVSSQQPLQQPAVQATGQTNLGQLNQTSPDTTRPPAVPVQQQHIASATSSVPFSGLTGTPSPESANDQQTKDMDTLLTNFNLGQGGASMANFLQTLDQQAQTGNYNSGAVLNFLVGLTQTGMVVSSNAKNYRLSDKDRALVFGAIQNFMRENDRELRGNPAIRQQVLDGLHSIMDDPGTDRGVLSWAISTYSRYARAAHKDHDPSAFMRLFQIRNIAAGGPNQDLFNDALFTALQFAEKELDVVNHPDRITPEMGNVCTQALDIPEVRDTAARLLIRVVRESPDQKIQNMARQAIERAIRPSSSSKTPEDLQRADSRRGYLSQAILNTPPRPADGANKDWNDLLALARAPAPTTAPRPATPLPAPAANLAQALDEIAGIIGHAVPRGAIGNLQAIVANPATSPAARDYAIARFWSDTLAAPVPGGGSSADELTRFTRMMFRLSSSLKRNARVDPFIRQLADTLPRRISRDYHYSDEDMGVLRSLQPADVRMQLPLTVPNQGRTPGPAYAASILANARTILPPGLLASAQAAAGPGRPAHITFPIYHGNHWTGIDLAVTQTRPGNYSYAFSILDPMVHNLATDAHLGNLHRQAIIPQLAAALGVPSGGYTANLVLAPYQQHDSTSCGPCTVANLTSYASGNPPAPHIHDTNDLRMQQMRDLSTTHFGTYLQGFYTQREDSISAMEQVMMLPPPPAPAPGAPVPQLPTGPDPIPYIRYMEAQPR